MQTEHSSIISFPRKSCFLHNTIFIFIDWQVEYLSAGRAYALGNIEVSLNNSLKLLELAREYGMTIAHFRKLMDGTFFNATTKFSNWIESFQPRANEMVFERKQPSIYSNPDFTAFLESIYLPELIVSGLTGERSCLSTAVESVHRNHKLTFVKDASASCSIGGFTERKSHDIVTDIINIYAEVSITQEILSSIKKKNIITGAINGHRHT